MPEERLGQVVAERLLEREERGGILRHEFGVHLGADASIGQLDDAHLVQLVGPDEERRMGGEEQLVRLGQPRQRRAELALLESVQAESGLVQEEDRISVVVLGLGEEHDEEGDEPLEALGALVELDLDPEGVLHHHLEVLLVGLDADRVVGPRAPRAARLPGGLPHLLDLLCEPERGGVQGGVALVEPGPVAVEGFAVGGGRLFGPAQVRELPGREVEELEQAEVAEVVGIAFVDPAVFDRRGQVAEMQERRDPGVRREVEQDRQALAQLVEHPVVRRTERDRLSQGCEAIDLERVGLVDVGRHARVQPRPEPSRLLPADRPGVHPGPDDLVELLGGQRDRVAPGTARDPEVDVRRDPAQGVLLRAERGDGRCVEQPVLLLVLERGGTPVADLGEGRGDGPDRRLVVVLQVELGLHDVHVLGPELPGLQLVVLGPGVVPQRFEGLCVRAVVDVLERSEHGGLARLVGAHEDGLGRFHAEPIAVPDAPIVLDPCSAQTHAVPTPPGCLAAS